MPLYIAMVALARYLTLDMKALNSPQMIGIAGAILLLSFAVLIVRYGHVKFPYKEKVEQPPKTPISG
jgi:protein PsiE